MKHLQPAKTSIPQTFCWRQDKTAVKTDVGQQTAAQPFLLAIALSNITQQNSSPHGLGDKSKRPCNVNLLARAQTGNSGSNTVE
jgi:hypothetical protein